MPPAPALPPSALAGDRAPRLGPGLALVAALLGAASQMAQAAADAQFLAELGAERLGVAVAISSAILAVLLSAVGALADRAGRARLLPWVCVSAAAGLAGFAALAELAPRAAAWLGLLGAKQLAATAELAFWLLAGEQLDARQSVRAFPRLAAATGAGGAISALGAVPLARQGGAAAVLVGAAALFLAAAAVAAALPRLRWVGREAPSATAPSASGVLAGARLGRSVREGLAALGASRLARQLAVLIAASGAFSTLAFLELSAVAAARHGTDHALAAVLSTVRSAGSVLTLVAQLVVSPWLLRRLGTGGALLVSPLWALVAVAVFATVPALAGVAIVAVVARGLDQAVETPASRLVHVLLPPAIRGRAVGAVEGLAKRGGAIVAGLVGGALVAWPAGFALVAALVAAGYLTSALAMARRLPALAVAAPASGLGDAPGTVTRSPSLGPRALEALARELGGPREQALRAADVLAQLARQGQPAALLPLLSAAPALAPLWSVAVPAVAATPRAAVPSGAFAPPALGALDEPDAVAAVVVGALAGAPASWLAGAAAEPRAAVALAAALCARYLDEPDAALGDVADELRHGQARERAAAALCATAWARRAAAEGDGGRVLAAAWPLVAAARRDRIEEPLRARALEELVELVAPAGGAAPAEVALFYAELWALAAGLVARRARDAAAPALAARGLALLRALVGTRADSPARDVEDAVALAAAALGDRDEEVAEAAAAVLSAIGVPAMAELLVVVGYGRRGARDRAAALLRASPATVLALERLIERELGALEHTVLAEGGLACLPAPAGDAATDALLLRRLGDRAREIAHSVLLLVAAQRRLGAVAQAAVAWRHARGRHERARALAVLDTTLPRPLAGRLLDAVDERPVVERARRIAARRGIELPGRAQLLSDELRGGDALARRLVLGALPAEDLAAHRGDLAAAAERAVAAADPRRLLLRLVGARADDPIEEGRDMPAAVETLLALSKVALFSELSTRQLDELARRARWQTVAAGAVVAVRGQPLLALVLVESGALRAGERELPAGSVIDELAWVAPRPPAEDIVATAAGRLIVLERAAFEELADDVPGLGAALCRALGERLRSAASGAAHGPGHAPATK